ncbi:hypothetical protein B484DRAFT_456889 [Ochromonadaceae sp. CCMP2298]|nr:hypothetical protein B484DRAFT_456889 [Ochromonadaceae sp. CCMP2298]|mmetsp:Transcript_12388/g.27807  ORF Transcript_12388/g.27807 Transcript_12388/m.27807 type:complete len:189 (+) Transcript_12388:495-1061(+)
MEDGAEVANLGPPATAPAGPAMARQDTGGAVVPLPEMAAPAPSAAPPAALAAPSDCTVKKRKRHSEGGDSKSKNSRPTNSRSSATGALNNLVNVIAARQAPAQDASAQMMQQMQMQMQMMMMMMKHFAPPNTPYPMAPPQYPMATPWQYTPQYTSSSSSSSSSSSTGAPTDVAVNERLETDGNTPQRD